MFSSNLTKWSSAIALCLLAAVVMPSCSKDEPENPDNGNPVDPTTPIEDPTGTITLNMRNDDDHASMIASRLSINEEMNFVVSDEWNYSEQKNEDNYIASVGTVSGLGNVSSIPESGWAKKMKVTKGCGYVFYNDRTKEFYRIYVVDNIYSGGSYVDDSGNVIGSVLGATVKYQFPFKGLDQDLILDNASITFEPDEGQQTLMFSNTSLTVFTIECDQEWCQVQKASSLSGSFLANGINVSVDHNKGSERTANITLRTGFGKETHLTVTQTGLKPILSLTADELPFPADAETRSVGLMTNIDLNSITITSDQEWCEPYVYDGTYWMRRKAASVRWIGSKKHEPSRYGEEGDAMSYALMVYVQPNTDERRQATVTVTGGGITERLKVIQEGIDFYITNASKNGELELSLTVGPDGSDENGSMLRFNSNIDNDMLDVSCDADWVKDIELSDYKASGVNANKVIKFNVSKLEGKETRHAKFTITSTKSDDKLELTVSQEQLRFTVGTEKIYFDRKKGYYSVLIDCNVPGAAYTPVCDAEWISFSQNGNTLTVYVTAASENRVATVSFKEFPEATFEVHQSKYAVKDTYTDDAAGGTVGSVANGVVYVYKDLGSAKWSEHTVFIGAIDEENGKLNMEKIRTVPDYKENYPAFGLVDELNEKDGINDWYLPAIKELTTLPISTKYWSSTEKSTTHAYYYYDYGQCHSDRVKSERFPVYAIRKFTF